MTRSRHHGWIAVLLIVLAIGWGIDQYSQSRSAPSEETALVQTDAETDAEFARQACEIRADLCGTTADEAGQAARDFCAILHTLDPLTEDAVINVIAMIVRDVPEDQVGLSTKVLVRGAGMYCPTYIEEIYSENDI